MSSKFWKDDKEIFIPWYSDEYTGPVYRNKNVTDYLSMSPQDIKAELEKYVLNQEETCRQVAIMMYQHLHGHRFVGMLAGPTGSGKSYIAESLKEVFPDVVNIRDVSNVTCDGWKGDKKVSTLFKGIHYPVSYNGLIFPLLFLDECDKMFSPRVSSSGENVSESVQSEFLTIIHGGEIEVKENGIGGKEDVKTIDTTRFSFLFAGAFEKKARLIAENESDASIGFGASHNKLSSYNRDITMEDVIEAGCMPEFGGRIQRLICLKKFEECAFLEILNAKDRGPIYEMEKEFNLLINISETKKEELAHTAYIKGMGIRGIKNEIRRYIDELTWEDCNSKELDIV